MKAFKIVLVVVLVFVTVLFTFSTIHTSLSGANQGPTLSCDSDVLEVSISSDSTSLLSGVTATDPQDGDITSSVFVLSISKFIEDSTAKITYVVFDSDDNMATLSRQLRYTDYTSPTFTITEPLIYAKSATVALLDRLHVNDVLDGDLTQSIRVSSMISTSDPEVYTIDVRVTNAMGDTAQLTLPIIMQESTLNRAAVNLSSYLTYISAGSSFNANSYLRSVTTPQGNGSLSDVSITGSVNTAAPGTYYVYYSYQDQNCSGTSILTVVVQ